MIDKYECPDCKKGYRTYVKGDYTLPLYDAKTIIHDAEYFECDVCHARSLGAKLVKKINELRIEDGKDIITAILKNGFVHTKEVSYLQNITGFRDVDLVKTLKIPKSTISNWDKRNTVLPYHLSILLAGIFAKRLKIQNLESEVNERIQSILIAHAS
jgi:hypothetical protein